MEISSHSIERLEDPFGILSGERYEFYIHINVSEDDELFSDRGLKVKVLFIRDEKGDRISHYHIIENETEKVLDFNLDEDEEQQLFHYCKDQLEKK